MTRRLLNLLTALSLLLCAAECVVWVRSYRHQDYFHRSRVRYDGVIVASESVHSSAGRVWIDWNWSKQTPFNAAVELQQRRVLRASGVRPELWAHARYLPHPPEVPSERLGFHFFYKETAGTGGPPAGYGSAGMPHAIVAMWTAVLPAVYVRLTLRDRFRRLQGACTKCGYDLTGNVSGVCPECGKAKA